MISTALLSAEATAQALPYVALADAIEQLLHNPAVVVPPRLIQPLPQGGSLFVMPAHDDAIAITKLITFVADNAARGLPTIQGDIVVFDALSGQRLCIVDGPTVTARRTAAVSLLAARHLASDPAGRLLIVGAGVQGRAHLEAFHAGLGTKEVWVHSRSTRSAEALAARAVELGMVARVVDDADEALEACSRVVSATPAQGIALRAMPRADAFVAAVGAFTPRMAEWSADVCQRLAREGMLVVDTRDADHEAGDLLQAGIDVQGLSALRDVLAGAQAGLGARPAGPVFFKSCGWAGWDLAAARCLLSAVAG
jgi:ornithine cyclodeaminase